MGINIQNVITQLKVQCHIILNRICGQFFHSHRLCAHSDIVITCLEIARILLSDGRIKCEDEGVDTTFSSGHI